VGLSHSSLHPQKTHAAVSVLQVYVSARLHCTRSNEHCTRCNEAAAVLNGLVGLSHQPATLQCMTCGYE
jgi:hypothetical protein